MLILRYALIATAFLDMAFAIESVRTVNSARPFASSSRLPVMSQGHLFFIEQSPVIPVYAPSGQPAFTIELKSPSRPAAIPADAAMSGRGQTAVSFAYTDDTLGYQGAIAIFDNTGKQSSLITTGRFMPMHLCFGADSATIWAAGWQRDAVKRDSEDEQDYMIVRRWNGQGELTGSYVKRSSFPLGLSPGGGFGGRWGIRAARGRVGMQLMSGETSERMVWLELDDNGEELGRWTLPAEHTDGMAFTGGQLYSVTSTWNRDTSKAVWMLNQLDRSTSKWNPVLTKEWIHPGVPGSFGILMDADDDKIVLARENGSILEWMKP